MAGNRSKTTERNGIVEVSAHYRNKSTGETSTDLSERLIEVQAFEIDHVAEVDVRYGMTINLGNFESARLDIGVKLPCYAEERDEALVAARAFVEEEMRAQVSKIKANRRGEG